MPHHKHTPGPWKIQKGPNNGDPIRWISGSEFESVCDLYSRDRNKDLTLELFPFPNAATNAEFIVRACNNHEQLLEACIKVARDFERAGNVGLSAKRDILAAIAAASKGKL